MKKYWILAFPAKHSLSPLIHNTWFQELDIDSQYLIFEISKDNLWEFIKKVRKEKIAGLSVSMPHKKEIIKYLDEIDEISEKLESVNTTYWKNWKLYWTNTDIYWILLPIQKIIKNSKFETDSKFKIRNSKLKAAIIWAWWAAAAACYALKQITNNITIFNRTYEKALLLAQTFWITALDIQNFESKNFDIIIQMTSVWMWENSNEIIIPNLEFNKNQIAFESIYHPINTEFIKRAKKAWAKIITWEKMLISQAFKQFELWTWEKLPTEKIIEKLCLKSENS